MDCKYFGRCGACVVYDGGYEVQLDKKLKINQQRFEDIYGGKISLFRSEDAHYRYRSEFKIWHDNDDIYYGMNSIDRSGVVLVDECPQVANSIAELMPKLLKEIKQKEITFKLFGVDFLSSSTAEIVVSLIYHKKLDAIWEQKAKEIANTLGIYIIGRSRKQKVVIGQDFVTEKLLVNGMEYRFKHIENSFTQPNARVNEKMISWAVKSFEDAHGDLLELYCGAGNFTIPFAKIFGKILATEISKSSINAAKTNMKLNGVENIEFIRMGVEEFRDALDGVREFRRMRDIDINSYHIDSIFVDPPRSGMDAQSCEFASRYDNIVYISCNPETLRRDLQLLCKTHEVKDMALFDQFAYTHHVEMGVKLKRIGL